MKPSEQRRRSLEKRIKVLKHHPQPIESGDVAMLAESILYAVDVLAFGKRGPPQKVFLAIHDAHEMHVHPCADEETAYEYLADRAINSRDSIPEGLTPEEVVEHWHELTGDEYMRVEGPIEVYRGG
jgi:hypothetical protein